MCRTTHGCGGLRSLASGDPLLNPRAVLDAKWRACALSAAAGGGSNRLSGQDHADEEDDKH